MSEENEGLTSEQARLNELAQEDTSVEAKARKKAVYRGIADLEAAVAVPVNPEAQKKAQKLIKEMKDSETADQN